MKLRYKVLEYKQTKDLAEATILEYTTFLGFTVKKRTFEVYKLNNCWWYRNLKDCKTNINLNLLLCMTTQ